MFCLSPFLRLDSATRPASLASGTLSPSLDAELRMSGATRLLAGGFRHAASASGSDEEKLGRGGRRPSTAGGLWFKVGEGTRGQALLMGVASWEERRLPLGGAELGMQSRPRPFKR